jgi:hypothetical protein
MGSRCSCDRIEAMLEGSPWFKTLPGGARWLCFKLVKLMATPSYAGAIPFADPRRVSLLVSMEVSEVETHLETLIETGLLARDDRDRLSCPALGDVAARTAAARQNGARGGRPRKGESSEDAARRRQGELLMPIGGAPEKPSETQRWETPSAGAAPRTTSSSSLKSETTPPVAREGEWQQLARDVIAKARLALKRPDWTPARAWLEAGATPELVLRVVAEMAARSTFDPSKITTIGYFTPAITRAIEQPPAALPGERVSYGHEDTDFDRRVRAWEESGHRGPPPRLAQPQQHAA